MTAFLSGAIAATCAAIAAFFLRFYRERADRLFGFFAVAFLILGLDWAALALLPPHNPLHQYLYVIRLLAFVVILGAIIDKNRAG